MAEPPPCDEFARLAPELALNVLAGHERALALEHAASCAGCARQLLELSLTAEHLLSLAPSHEPPPGFETRVLKAIERERPGRGRPRSRTPRWRRHLALAATAAVATGVGVAATLIATRTEREAASHYQDVLARAGGQYFALTELRNQRGARQGLAFAYQGESPWLLIMLDAPVRSARYRAEIVTRRGETIELGEADLSERRPAFGLALPVAVHDIAQLRLVPARGERPLTGAFPPPGG